MRIKFTIEAKGLAIPRNYQHHLQAIIYNGISNNQALHDSQDFKRFNFSLMKGDFVSVGEYIVFLKDASFLVSSSNDEMMKELKKNYLNKKELCFGHYHAPIISIEEVPFPLIEDEADILFLSPVTIHKTLENGKTLYLNPNNEDFFQALNENFCHKCELENQQILEFSEIRKIKKIITTYKDFIIEAYQMKCHLKASNKYLKEIYNVGLGDRNSYGFGMIKFL